MKTNYNFRILIAFASILLLSLPVLAQSPVQDLLLYFDTERDPPGITAYNPETGEKILLPIMEDVTISTNGMGKIAYIQGDDVWVLDVLTAPNNPINITQTPDEEETFLNWTPDGQLLQYRVGSDSEPNLLYNYDGNNVQAVDYGYNLSWHWNEEGWYVAPQDSYSFDFSWYAWNGQERIDLEFPPLSAEPVWQTFHWTPNNHLFITVGYEEDYWQLASGPTEIYYWNGEVVQEVIRPTQAQNFVLSDWSADGRLLLYTHHNDFGQHWYIWDGISFTPNGIPDTSALTAINNQEQQIASIQWMPDGRLAIVEMTNTELSWLPGLSISCPEPCLRQLYLWDEQTLVQVTDNTTYLSLRIDIHDSGSIIVSRTNGLVTSSFTVFNSSLESVFESNGPYSISRWSSDGNLAFCRGQGLYVWNGQDTVRLGREIYSKWLIAQSWSMFCSVG